MISVDPSVCQGAGVSEPRTIAIIDDDSSLREALTGLLRALGREVRAFDSAEAFLASGVLADTGCIVTDIQMPGMSGIDLKSALEATRRHIPAILITACTDAGLDEKAKACGALCLLRKPFEADTLIARIDEALG